MLKNNLELMNSDSERRAWPYDKSASWKDSSNVNDSLPQRFANKNVIIVRSKLALNYRWSYYFEFLFFKLAASVHRYRKYLNTKSRFKEKFTPLKIGKWPLK